MTAKLPPITVTENHQIGEYNFRFLVSIEHGPVHHGVAETLDRALYNAVWAWNNYEEEIRARAS